MLPSLSLLTTSPPFLSAALSIASPLPQPAATAALPATPVEWSLTPQDAGAPSGSSAPPAPPPPEGEPPEGDGAEIIVEGEYGPPAGDPVEKINAESYRIIQAVDQAVVEPLAYAYRDGLPEPIRDGLGNVVRNLGEPSNALNFLLQGKVGMAFETLGRLAINSTVGVGGLFDVAGKKADLPYRRNGFANTMGFYGVGPGPYLYLPVTGATSVRDLLGRTLDQFLLPIVVGKPFNQTEFGVSYFVVNGLDQRLAFDEEIAAIRATEDPYGVRRDTYLAKRRRDIAALKGEVVEEEEAEVPAPTGDSPPQGNLNLPERVQLTAGASPDPR